MTTNIAKEPLAVFYAMQNEYGEYYRTNKSGSGGARWVKDLKAARLWTTAGQARSKITTYSNENPKAVVPELVEFIVTEVRVVDQKARVAASREKKAIEQAAARARIEQWHLARAEEAYQRAKRELEKIKGAVKHDDDCTCKSCMGM